MSTRYFDDANQSSQVVHSAHRERWRERENIQRGTPDNKRRHHFVPQMWLRNWTDPTSQQLRVVDVGELADFGASTKNLMVINDLYRVGTEASPGYDMGPEEAFASIEGAGASAIRALLANEPLSEDGRYDLALTVALQHLRVPEVIARAVPEDPSGTKAVVESFAAALLAKPDGPPPPEFQGIARGRSSHELAQSALEGFPEYAAIERGFSFWNLLEAAHDLAQRVHRRQWAILRTELSLLLSDNPVSLPPLGATTFKVGGKTSVIDTPVPIGPGVLLLIGDRPDGAGSDGFKYIDHYAAISNEIQLHNAHRFVVVHPSTRGIALLEPASRLPW